MTHPTHTAAQPITSYTYLGQEVGVCVRCGTRYAEHGSGDFWLWYVLCPDHRPAGIAVEPHPLIGKCAVRHDHISGDLVEGVIKLVQVDASGHAMLGLDVDQKQHGQSLSSAKHFDLSGEVSS